MKITSPKLETSHLTPSEEIQVRCKAALDLKDRGDYEGAKEVMRPFWKRIGEKPAIKGLYPSVAAEVLLCAGIVSCWIGSKSQIKEAQDSARDLITESITFYESEGDVLKVAAARVELAYCYWCEGSLDEARVVFRESLQKLTVEGNTRARAILGLAVVEWTATQYHTALQILTDHLSLFNKITNQATKGAYHSQTAIVLRHLAKTEKRDENYRNRLVGAYQSAPC